MPFLALHVVLSFLLDLAHVLARRDHDKTIALVLLRQQLRLYERQTIRPRPSRWEKVALATLAARLPDLSRACLGFTPTCPGRVAHPSLGPNTIGQEGPASTADERTSQDRSTTPWR